MSRPSDKDIIRVIGVETLTAHGFSLDCVKKWRQRGIPWQWRAKVARLAASKRIKIPADFAEVRPAA